MQYKNVRQYATKSNIMYTVPLYIFIYHVPMLHYLNRKYEKLLQHYVYEEVINKEWRKENIESTISCIKFYQKIKIPKCMGIYLIEIFRKMRSSYFTSPTVWGGGKYDGRHATVLLLASPKGEGKATMNIPRFYNGIFVTGNQSTFSHGTNLLFYFNY